MNICYELRLVFSRVDVEFQCHAVHLDSTLVHFLRTLLVALNQTPSALKCATLLHKNLRITAILLAIWFVVTYVVGYMARDLNFTFFGWPFSFWMGAQGSLIIYVLIIGFYARYMNKLDQEFGVAEEE